MTISDAIYEFLTERLTIPQIWEGVAPRDVSAEEGLLTYTRLPSPATESVTGITLTQYQFSIRHKDLLHAQLYSEELIDVLLGYSGTIGDYEGVNFFMESHLGDLEEAESDLWVVSVIFNVKYVR